jgi:hypothetical protein
MDAAAELRRVLGAAPPDSIANLPAPVLERLVGQIEAAREHHRRVAEDAVRTVISGAPLPVRGIVRKALQ